MTASYKFGRFELRPATRQFLVDDQPAPLGARAFDVLRVLIERRERLVAKDELLELAWPGLVVEENNLQVQVSALRKILGNGAIATVAGRGYRLVFDVETASAPAPQLPRIALNAQGSLTATAGELLGRESELAALAGALAEHALCTVLGPGGVGKTTLALAAAEQFKGRLGDGVWWVDLSALPRGADGNAIARAVAARLGLALGVVADATATLANALAPLSMLLVLDNAEHVISGVAELVEDLVNRSTTLRILVTSQRALQLRQEHLFPLGTLAVPAEGTSLSEARSHGALALLEKRARLMNPRFALDEASLPQAIEICRCLDGLPLALELAAARISWLGVAAVCERLTKRFQMLAAPRRDGPQHQQTLRSAMDWSHALLTTDQQAVLHALGVFTGGFTLDLAEHLAATALRQDAWTLLDTLGTLVETCWVQVDDSIPPRYRLLDSARLYALDQLATAGTLLRTRSAHAQTMARLAERHFEVWFQQRVDQWSALYVPETDNLCAAMDTAIELGDAPMASGLFVACNFALNQNDRVHEMARRATAIEPLLTALTPAQLLPTLSGMVLTRSLLAPTSALDMVRQAVALSRQGVGDAQFGVFVRTQLIQLLVITGSVAEADALLEEARAQLVAPWPILRMNMASMELLVRLFQDRTEEAIVSGHQAIALAESLHARRAAAMVRANVTACVLQLGRYEEVVTLVRQMLPTLVGIRWASARTVALCNLLHAQVELDQWAEGHQTALEALPLARRSGYMAAYLEGVASLAGRDGRASVAASLIGHIQALEASGRAKPQPGHLQQRGQTLDRLATQLSPQHLAAALALGTQAGDDEVDALVRTNPTVA